MGHGGGGRLAQRLLERTLWPAFANPYLDRRDDQAVLPVEAGRIAFTTDSFVVRPLVFPGGDLGSLAVHGTVNDLAMAGARPVWMSTALILEEGTPLATVERVVASLAAAARAAGVAVVTGDTKVVGKGQGDQIYVSAAGIGIVPPGLDLTARAVRPGDAILVSGTLGEHGMAVLAAREELGLIGDLKSDSAPLHLLVGALLADPSHGVRALRDPTRGGVAAVLTEIARASGTSMEVEEAALPVSDPVRGATELLGLDPLLVACEGRLVAFVDPARADAALAALRAHPQGTRAARIGTVGAGPPGTVTVRTALGPTRVLDLPLTDPLPRIC